MYPQLLSYLYDLEIGGEVIGESDIRRQTIERIVTTIRRNDSSSLNITFSDPTLYWHSYFSEEKEIHIKFRGYNLDGSAAETFEGYTAMVYPNSDLTINTIEVMFLDVPVTMNTPTKRTRTFDNMTRRSVVQTLASEYNAHVFIETTRYVDQVEESLSWGINTTAIQFLSRILEEIGYRISVQNTRNWIVTPIISTNPARLMHSNQGGDGSLLSFRPTFNHYMFNESEPPVTEGGTAIDPDTGKEEVGEAPEDDGLIDTVKKKAQSIYDSQVKTWFKLTD